MAESGHAEARARGVQITALHLELKMATRRLAHLNFALTRGHDAALAGEAEALTVRVADLQSKLEKLKSEAA